MGWSVIMLALLWAVAVRAQIQEGAMRLSDPCSGLDDGRHCIELRPHARHFSAHCYRQRLLQWSLPPPFEECMLGCDEETGYCVKLTGERVWEVIAGGAVLLLVSACFLFCCWKPRARVDWLAATEEKDR